MNMKLSFSTLGCPGWDLPTIAARASAYGFDGVELRIGGDKHVDPSMDACTRQETRRLFEERGIAICSLGGYTLFDSDDRDSLEANKQQMLKNIEMACDLGAPYVRTFMGGKLPDGDIGIRAEYLHECSEIAHQNGVMILIETHDANKSGKRCAEIIKAADSAGIGVLWDMHHTCRDGETPAQTYAQLGSLIRHLHLKDAKADHRLCLMGEGVLPISEVVRVLEENRYQGFLSLEWEKMWVPELDEPEVALPQYVAYMRAL